MKPGPLEKFSLFIAVLVLGCWGVIVIFHPELVHSHLSNEPMNHTYAGMMGAALLGLAFISFTNFIAVMKPTRSLGIAILVLVVVSALLMFVAKTMIISPLTSISLIFAAAIAIFLITLS